MNSVMFAHLITDVQNFCTLYSTPSYTQLLGDHCKDRIKLTLFHILCMILEYGNYVECLYICCNQVTLKDVNKLLITN